MRVRRNSSRPPAGLPRRPVATAPDVGWQRAAVSTGGRRSLAGCASRCRDISQRGCALSRARGEHRRSRACAPSVAEGLAQLHFHSRRRLRPAGPCRVARRPNAARSVNPCAAGHCESPRMRPGVPSGVAMARSAPEKRAVSPAATRTPGRAALRSESARRPVGFHAAGAIASGLRRRIPDPHRPLSPAWRRS